MPRMVHELGSLLDTPPGSLLIHACNCQGLWGSGVAEQLKERFPSAYLQYQAHCLEYKRYGLLGTAAIFPSHPVIDGVEVLEQTYYIGCAFTSERYGVWKGAPEQVTAATHMAMAHMYTRIKGLRKDGLTLKPVYSTRLNSGNFKVDWKWTEFTLKEIPWKTKVWNPVTKVDDFHCLRLHVRTINPEDMAVELARQAFRSSEEGKKLDVAAAKLEQDWLQKMRKEEPLWSQPFMERTGPVNISMLPNNFGIPQVIEID